MNDAKRAALIAFASSAFPVLELAGIVSLTSDQVAAVMLLVTNAITLGALLFKKGQEPGP